MHAYLITGGDEKLREIEANKLLSGISEILSLETDKSHTIEEIRRLQKTLTLYPLDPEKGRGVVIKEAQLLTLEAANSFLKTLENPQGKTTIILTAPNSEGILETIRSRTQNIYLGINKNNNDLGEACQVFETICKNSTGRRLEYADTISDRDVALSFCEEQLRAVRFFLLKKTDEKLLRVVELLQRAHDDLLANVNVKMVIAELLLNYPEIITWK